jgi:hypothetical protein
MQKNVQRPTITVGELCAAIAEGRLPATLDDNQWYQVNGRELRRFVTREQQRRARPAPRALCSSKG